MANIDALRAIPIPPRSLMMSHEDLWEAHITQAPFTVAVISPPASQKHMEAIYERISREGFQIGECNAFYFTKRHAEIFCKAAKEKPSFEGLVKQMCTGPSIFLALYTTNPMEDPVKKWLELVGLQSLAEAKIENPQSLRALYGNDADSHANGFHGSTGVEEAAMEKSILTAFFSIVTLPSI